MTQPTTTSRLRPFKPTPFGRYTLLLPLSTGGMGEIFLARQDGAQGFEKLCVVKRILPHLAEDPDFVARFINEAKTLAKLSHGAIAQVLDLNLVDGTPYLAMEYIDGKDLRRVSARMRDKNLPMPLTFVLYVMGRVLDALAYAHRKRDDEEREIGLVHRDVSPQNILISYEGEVKVIDFGLAKSTLNSSQTNPSIVLGKFLYMSPEQARHQNVDRRSDLYAVGLCMYELIAGKNPFDDEPSGELMMKVASPQIRPLNQVEPLTPPAVTQLVMRALAPDPAQRFQTAEDFRARLMAILMEIDPSAGPENASRFMREAFVSEHAAEKKLHASLREAVRVSLDEPDTGVHLVVPPGRPPLEPVPFRRDVSPLSFKPTPTNRALNTDFTDRDRETMPGVIVDDMLREVGRAPEPETGQMPVVLSPDDTLPPPDPSPAIISGRLVEPTEPAGMGLRVPFPEPPVVGLRPAEPRGRASSPAAAKLVLRPDQTTDSTDPSLAPVKGPPGLKKVEPPKLTVTPPMPFTSTLMDVGAVAAPGAALPHMVLATPMPVPARQSKTQPETAATSPVVERVPRALLDSAPPMNVDTKRTRSSGVNPIWIVMPLLAVLGVAGYVIYDLWLESQQVTDHEKEMAQPKPDLKPTAPKREPPKVEPPPPKVEPPPEDLAALTAPAPKGPAKKKPGKVTAAEKAYAEMLAAYDEYFEKTGGGGPFKVKRNAQCEKPEKAEKMASSEESVYVTGCNRLRDEIRAASNALVK